MDISINELLLKTYFKDYTIHMFPEIGTKMCLILNCFNRPVLEDQNFEYYYLELLKDKKKFGIIEQIIGFDDHILASSSSFDMPKGKNIEIFPSDSIDDLDLTEKTLKEKLDKEKNNLDLLNTYSRSLETAEEITSTINSRKNLDTYLLQIVKGSIRNTIREKSYTIRKNSWHSSNRRFLSVLDPNMMLPSSSEVFRIHPIRAVFYCDVSGSVKNISDKMLEILMNTNQRMIHFDIFAWASRVVNVQIHKNKVSYQGAGGGTSIQKVFNHFAITYETNPPDLVVVLTDGYYSDIKALSDKAFSSWLFCFTRPSSNAPMLSKQLILDKSYLS